MSGRPHLMMICRQRTRLSPEMAVHLQEAVNRGDAVAYASIARQVLRSTDRVLAPRIWASANLTLASALNNPKVRRVHPFYGEEAILRARGALEAYSETNDLINWLESLAVYAMSQVNRSRGDRASSLTIARECLERAYRDFNNLGKLEEASDAAMNLAGVIMVTPRPPLQEVDLLEAQDHAAAAIDGFTRIGNAISAGHARAIQAAAIVRLAGIFHRHNILMINSAIKLLQSALGDRADSYVPTETMWLAHAYLNRASWQIESAEADYAAAISRLQHCSGQSIREEDPTSGPESRIFWAQPISSLAQNDPTVSTTLYNITKLRYKFLMPTCLPSEDMPS